MHIREMQSTDYPFIKSIYQQGIDTQNATFEKNAPEWEVWNQRHLTHSRLVAVEGDSIIGFVALMPYSSRSVYQGVGVLSIYVHHAFKGRGIGKKLLQALIHESEQNGMWTLQAGILPENKASIYLHRKLGFRKVGYREKIAQMNGQWRDILIFERRSALVGNESVEKTTYSNALESILL